MENTFRKFEKEIESIGNCSAWVVWSNPRGVGVNVDVNRLSMRGAATRKVGAVLRRYGLSPLPTKWHGCYGFIGSRPAGELTLGWIREKTTRR